MIIALDTINNILSSRANVTTATVSEEEVLKYEATLDKVIESISVSPTEDSEIVFYLNDICFFKIYVAAKTTLQFTNKILLKAKDCFRVKVILQRKDSYMTNIVEAYVSTMLIFSADSYQIYANQFDNLMDKTLST